MANRTLYDNQADLLTDVSAAQQAALAESKKQMGSGGVHRSRGRFITVEGTDGNRHPEHSEEIEFHRVSKTVNDLIKEADEYRTIGAIWASGGIDFAESVQAEKDGDYQPWSASWDVLIWSREKDGEKVSVVGEPKETKPKPETKPETITTKPEKTIEKPTKAKRKPPITPELEKAPILGDFTDDWG